MNKISLIVLLFVSSALQAAVSMTTAVCTEKEESVLKEFLPMNFDRDRSTVGADQVEVIRGRIQEYITSHPDIKITKISVKSLSARQPFYVQQGKKKVIDTKSDLKNSNLARDRADFVKTLLLGMKNSKPELKETNLTIESGLAGPEFSATDLNDRFVTPLSEKYNERVKSFFNQNKELYEEVALKKSADDLLKEDQFPNLYQVKYKPFQGFRLEVAGVKKCHGSKDSLPSAIKQ